jgi:hypothetical protein
MHQFLLSLWYARYLLLAGALILAGLGWADLHDRRRR